MTTEVSSSIVRLGIRAALAMRDPLLLVGPPGIGKSDIVIAEASAMGHDVIVTHPGTQDPTDPKGLPWPNAKTGQANFLPFGDLKRALEAKKPTAWFLDDFGQANNAVQAPYMQLLQARHIGEHKLPDCVTFIAATNRRSDRAGVNGLLEPIKSRFATILHMRADLEEWLMWAYAHDINPKVAAFLRFMPDRLHQFQPSTELVNYPCPRTWAKVSKALNMDLLVDGLFLPFTAGAIGAAVAQEFQTFLSVYADLTMPEEVFLHPETARIPQGISTQYALSAALAHSVTEGNFDAVVTFATRMHDAGHGEVAGFLIKDVCRKNPAVTKTAAFVDMALGPLASILA